ncbi:MAG TPA: FkbM family methyltransferase, partial [Burkholderiales bacterium]|nr:FkbM family methyltransferase [Burkholderiales bacterium]
MSLARDLVFDVGMHNGDDTAYYLHKGYRVVAVEANGELVGRAQRRFERELRSGRLRILNVGIAAEAGEAEFFVSPGHDFWSSFDRRLAARAGAFRAVRVPCTPFAPLLEAHGVPFYLKIDIEGNDHLCLEALGRAPLPPHVSIEMSHETGRRDIEKLAALGYRRFQCIRQTDFAPMTPESVQRAVTRRRALARWKPARFAALAARAIGRRAHPPRDGNWRVPIGSSGPFGTGLAGPWLSAAEVLAVWRELRDVDLELRDDGLGEWFDIH